MAMRPAQMPISRRRSKLTGFGWRRKIFHGPSSKAMAVRNSAGYAVAMLNREIKSRRTAKSDQKNAVDARTPKAMVTLRMILLREENHFAFEGIDCPETDGLIGVVGAVGIEPLRPLQARKLHIPRNAQS